MSDPLVPGLPVISSLRYANTLINATLEFAPSKQVTAGLFQREVSGKPLITGTNVDTVVTMFYDGTLDPGTVYYVALTFDPANGPWGMPVAMVWQQPSLTAMFVSTGLVEVSWALPATTTISGVRASLVDVKSQSRIVSDLVVGSGMRFTPPVPLSPSGSYGISLVGTNGVASGPELTSPALPFASPAITSTAYTASNDNYDLTVTMRDTTPHGTSAVVQLLRDGIVVQQQTSADNPVTLTVSQPLDPRSKWQVDAYYLTGVMAGPASFPFTIEVPDAPAIASVLYGGGFINVVLAEPPVPQVTVALFKGSPSGTGWITSSKTTGASAALNVDPNTLDPSFQYTLALTLDAGAPVVKWGPGVTLVWQQPTLAAVRVTPDAVEVGWTLPPVTTITGVQASIYDTTTSSPVVSGAFTGSGGRLVPALPLDPNHVYTVSIGGANGVAKSIAVTLGSLILGAPSIAEAVYTPGTTVGTWQLAVTPSPANSPPGTVTGQLLANGAVVATQAASDGTVTFPLAQSLDAATAWKVALLYQSGIVSGPAGVAAEIPLAPPQLTAARYDGTIFSVEWTGASGANVIITRTDDESVVASATIVSGFSAKLRPGPAIDDTKTYVVTLAPTDGTARGLAGPQTALIVSQPLLSTVTSDGDQVVVALTGADANATATELVLSSSDGTIATVPAGVHGGIAILPRGGMSGLTVAARSVGAGIAGPLSSVAGIVVAMPSITEVAFADNVVTGRITAPAGVTLDTSMLYVTLYAEGVPVGTPVQAAGDGTFSVPAASVRSATLTLRANVTGTASNVGISGPQSPPVPVLTSSPSIVSASLVQTGASLWQLTAAWAAPAGHAIASYRVVLVQDGATLQTWAVSGTSLTETAPAFDGGKAVTLAVTPLGNYGNGPSSNSMTFLTSAVSEVSARIDGNIVSAAWSAVTTAGTPTAFRLRLVQSVQGTWITVGQSEAAAGTTALLSLPSSVPDSTATFGIAVDAAVDNAWAATQSVSTLVTTAPAIASAAAADAGSVGIAWNWPNGTTPAAVDGYLPVILWNGTETPLAKLPATPLNATITLPPSIPNDAAVAIRALGGTATGPSGAGAPLLFQPPQGLAVAYDGTTVSASWHASSDPRVSAWSVTFKISDQEAVAETVTGTTWSKAFTPATGQTATVTVAAVAGVATGGAAAPLGVILSQPAITGALFDGTTLVLTWTAATDAAAEWTLISILSGGTATRQIVAGGTTTAIPLANGPFTLRVQGAGGATLGALSAAVTPITGTASIDPVSFSVTDGTLTLSWSAVPNAGAYHVALRGANGVTRKQATTHSLTLAKGDLPASGVYNVSVQAVASSVSDTIAGPWCAEVPLVLIEPPSIDLTYDGRNGYVSWAPVPAEQVSGYAVTLLDGTTAVSTTATSGTSARIAAPYDSAKNYQVVVQAMTSAGAAQPSAAMPLFGEGWYLSTSPADASYLKPFATCAMTDADIVVYLPNIFATYVTEDLPSTAPFKFSTTSKTPFVYTLTMAAGSIVFSFDGNTPRQEVLAAYRTLLGNLHTLGVTPLGLRIVQDAIARAMPQTFGETLFYAYAFDPANATVDLKPGMLLRADFESYQYLGPDQAGSRYLDGFVSSSSSEYEIGSYVAGSQWLTGFDAFLSTVTQQGTFIPTPSNDGSNASGGGGIVDLYYSQLRQPFVRLVYPPSFPASTEGNARPAYNVAVLAAVDYPTLESATDNLRNARPPGSGAWATYLRGRTTVSVCIRIWLNGIPRVVPIGTTVGNLLESLAARPPIFPLIEGGPATTPGIPIRGLMLTRATGYAITDPAAGSSGYDIGGGTPIMLDWAGGMAYNALSDWLSLPLLSGDRLTTEGRG